MKYVRSRRRATKKQLTPKIEIQAVPVYQDEGHSEQVVVPYDENLYERVRTLWQFGDWESLVKLDCDSLQDHPDRAQLALLAGAGHLQTNNMSTARRLIRLARDWGCSRKLISQILIAGVYNSLGRVAVANGQEQRAIKHFEESIRIAFPGCDAKLLGEARIVRETTKLGLLPQAARLMGDQLTALKREGLIDKSRIAIFETELGMLHHELSLAQQRQQLFSIREPRSEDAFVEGSSPWIEALKKKAVSQLGQDLWVLNKTSYKRGGFFVEFGATDGVLLSNTWLLEKEFGWHGICAEPNPKFFEQLKRNRGCIVSNSYIGGVSGKLVEFVLADVYGGAAEYAADDQHREKREAYRNAGFVANVTTVSLDEFLKQNNAPSVIDYLSIDTEGSEYEILSTFPFEKWQIRMLTVEHNFTSRRREIRALLESHGYSCTEEKWDDWYEKGV